MSAPAPQPPRLPRGIHIAAVIRPGIISDTDCSHTAPEVRLWGLRRGGPASTLVEQYPRCNGAMTGRL